MHMHALAHAHTPSHTRAHTVMHARTRCPCPQASFEKNNAESGAFEDQYKRLMSDIEVIYKNAKEFHGKVGPGSSSGTMRPKHPQVGGVSKEGRGVKRGKLS